MRDMDLADLFPASRQQLSTLAQLSARGCTKHDLQTARRRGLIAPVRRGVWSPVQLPPRSEHLMTDGLLDLGYLARMRSVLLELGDRAVLGGRCSALSWGWDLL